MRGDQLLAPDDANRAQRYPGGSATRQPVHTVYVPADRVTGDTVAQWRTQALASVAEFGPLPMRSRALTACPSAVAWVLR